MEVATVANDDTGNMYCPPPLLLQKFTGKFFSHISCRFNSNKHIRNSSTNDVGDMKKYANVFTQTDRLG